jgi:prolyl oligopeptidase
VSGTLDGIPKAGIFALYAAGDADYVQLLEHGISRMVRIPYTGPAQPVPLQLPLNGSILEVATDQHNPGALVHLTSWTDRGDVYAFDPVAGSMTALGIVPKGNDEPRVAEELSATAADGTNIPVSVVHRPGIALDGSHPLILQVAGAYGFSLTPEYRSVPPGWLERGGIYAVAHVRGGGELGEAWHRAGMGDRKRNTWTDLISAAQLLIAGGYTSPKQLNLYGTTQSYLGGIASSIAIGRALEERPELFGAAVIDAPVFDMLRSERTPLGRQSISEFGSVATRAGFDALLAMSPYEHVRDGVRYPPVLVRSFSHLGLGDDWQAAKMVARLQAAAGRADAAYLDIEDGSRNRTQVRADALAFFLYEDGAH